MAVMESRDNRTFTAGADLSTHQLKFVKAAKNLFLGEKSGRGIG